MNLNRHTRKYAKQAFREYEEDIQVYLRSSKTKGNNFNPKYKVAYTKTNQNYLTVKAILRTEQVDRLVIKSLGLIAVGAKTILVNNNDVNTLKLAEKIVINDVEYEAYSEAVGKKFQEYDAQFGYTAIILFKCGN